MLVLSVRLGKSLQIGQDIRVRVLEIMGDKVRLGLEAPDDVVILRQELLERLGSVRHVGRRADEEPR